MLLAVVFFWTEFLWSYLHHVARNTILTVRVNETWKKKTSSCEPPWEYLFVVFKDRGGGKTSENIIWKKMSKQCKTLVRKQCRLVMQCQMLFGKQMVSKEFCMSMQASFFLNHRGKFCPASVVCLRFECICCSPWLSVHMWIEYNTCFFGHKFPLCSVANVRLFCHSSATISDPRLGIREVHHEARIEGDLLL